LKTIFQQNWIVLTRQAQFHRKSTGCMAEIWRAGPWAESC